MTRARISLGRTGEHLAEQELIRLGYEIIARNYRCAFGEIDLVTRHATDWVFVEVRTRRGARFGTPEESITARKRQHLITTAQHYLQAHQLEQVHWRIDAVAIELTPRGTLARLTVIENAVQG